MAKHILRCTKCGTYTLKENCPKCNSTAGLPKPPKYSPEDKYASLRRQVKRTEYQEKGLL
jgi:H/ACA ribonucleoprotein complex subunit 3